MPTSTDDRRELLTVIASIKAAPGKDAELRQGAEDPGTFYFYENGESAEFAGLIPDLLDKNGLTITLARIA